MHVILETMSDHNCITCLTRESDDDDDDVVGLYIVSANLSQHNLSVYFSTAKVGKTSLIMSLVSEEFPDVVWITYQSPSLNNSLLCLVSRNNMKPNKPGSCTIPSFVLIQNLIELFYEL